VECNRGHPVGVGTFVTKAETLSTRLEQATVRRHGTITFISGETVTPITWARLHDDARATAAQLQQRGIGPGSHVAILGPTTRPLVTTIQAIWLTGAAAVVLPLPMRLGSIEEFVDQTRIRIRNADAALLVIDPDLAAFYEAAPGDPPIVLLDELTARPVAPDTFAAPSIDPDSLAVLQFTSGSTADPKGVMLTHRQILANLDGAMVAAQIDPDTDVLVSWLRLYHDMGLIGLLTIPMITGTDLVLAPPQDFLGAPSRWLEWISAFGGTGTAGPNFSYALAARALKRASGLDLSRWRIALNGAEPVDPASVRAFCEAGAPFGLSAGAAFPAFGMAELAIAGTFPEPGSGLQVDVVDRTVLETERYAAPAEPGRDGVRALALLGRPIAGLEIRICDPHSGSPMAEREAGELEIRGTSVTPGYYKRSEDTAAAFHDDWLRTGDLAYTVDGQLVVCGRIKDVIIVGGRNVFPEDVERAAGEVDGVRAGNVIAFGIEGRNGRERLIVVAETRAIDPGPVRNEVARRVSHAVGLPPGEVVLVTPGSLPKTSSGKLQRSLCRTRYLGDALQPC
jgi:fatty-acyl-CoA synthase